MKMSRLTVGVLAGICMVGAPALRAQSQGAGANTATTDSLSKQLENLQKQVEALQAQIAEIKKHQEAATAASAATVPPAAPAPARPAPTLASLWGPTSISGLQDAAPAAPLVTATPAAPPAPAPPAPTLAGLLGSTSITGFVDGYYNYNFNQPHSKTSNLRAFDGPSNQLGLNMVELIVRKTPAADNGRLGYNLTFGFGNAMNAVNSADPGGLGFAQYLKEAYLSYLTPVGKGLQVDFGKFVTQHGAEVIETKDNWNYSRGLLFTYAIPFYHFGLRAKYTFNDKYNLTGFIVNGWNNIIDNNTGKTYAVQFGWNPSKKVSVVQNYMAGPETAANNHDWRQMIDTVITYTATKKLTLMWNYDYGRGDRIASLTRPVWWSGIAGYARYAFDDRYAIIARYEHYNDHDGFTTLTPQHLNELTATFERIIAKHLITRWEFRRDVSNRPSFVKGDLPVKAQNTITAGLVYVFDMSETK